LAHFILLVATLSEHLKQREVSRTSLIRPRHASVDSCIGTLGTTQTTYSSYSRYSRRTSYRGAESDTSPTGANELRTGLLDLKYASVLNVLMSGLIFSPTVERD
jgi:hypothetical protein